MHRKQEAEAGLLLTSVFHFLGSPLEGGRADGRESCAWALVMALDSGCLGEPPLSRVFLIQIPQ